MTRTTTIFGAAAGALAGIGLMASSALTPAHAQEEVALGRTNAPQATHFQTRNVSHNVPILQNADIEADRWVVGEPRRMAITVHIGQDTLVPSEVVESVLASDFGQQDVRGIQFYFEMGSDGDTTIAVHTDRQIWGPYALEDARAPVKEIADQHKFNLRMDGYEIGYNQH